MYIKSLFEFKFFLYIIKHYNYTNINFLILTLEYKDLPEANWGLKHTCQECGAKYYDMGRSSITCPLCGVLLVEKPILARSVPIPTNEPPPRTEEVETKIEDPVETEDSDDILPDDEVLPELEVEPDSVDEEEDLTSVLEETKPVSET